MPATAIASPVIETSPRTVSQWLASGKCTLIDVREPDEHAREHITGARLMPLSTFNAADFAAAPSGRLVFHCKAGRRSADAAHQAAAFAPGGTEIYTMSGGIDQWKSESLPVNTNTAAPRMSVMRQVQITIGIIVLIGLGVGYFVHPAGYLLPACMGAGLLFAGLSGTCALAALIARLPWNRATSMNCSVPSRN